MKFLRAQRVAAALAVFLTFGVFGIESGAQTTAATTTGVVYLRKILGPLVFGSLGDAGISRTAPSTIGVGNGTQGDVSGTISTAGAIISSNLAMGTTARIFWSNRAQITSPSDGNFVINNNALTIGSELKADALPTPGTCGTSPAVTAGSTPLAGSVNVGTGGVATSCTVTFGGTAFPAAPFCLATPTTTNAVTRASATTTVLTLATTTAWTASDVVNWICISSK